MEAVTGGLDGSPVVLIQGPPGEARGGGGGGGAAGGGEGRDGRPGLCAHTPTSCLPSWLSAFCPGTGKTKTILGLLSIIMHSAPKGAFAAAAPANGGGGDGALSPTAADAENLPS